MGITFNDESKSYSKSGPDKKSVGKVTAFIIKIGLANDAASANKIMLIIIVGLLFFILILFSFTGSKKPEPPAPEPMVNSGSDSSYVYIG